MDWKASFISLREVFPQVDERIIKAVALEHRNDVDSAVEFILNEVVPNQNDQIADAELDSERGIVDGPITEHDYHSGSEQLAPSSSHLSVCGSISDDDASEVSDEIILTDRRSDSERIVAHLMQTKINEEHASSLLSVNSLTDQETIDSMEKSAFLASMFSHLPNQSCDENTNQTSGSSSQFNSSQSQTRIENKGFSPHLDDMGEIKGDQMSCNEKSLIQFEDGNILEDVNVDKCGSDSKSTEVNLVAIINSAASSTFVSDTPIEQPPCTDATNVSSYEEANQCTEEVVVRTSESQLNFSVVEGLIKSLNTAESFYKESMDSLPLILITHDSVGSGGLKNDNTLNVELDTGSFISVEDGSLSCSQASSSSEIVNIDTLEGFVEHESLSCSRTSSSSQIVTVDTLEGFVSEAKKEKEMLVEAMELIHSLRAEADREEAAAQRAKEEAAKGGVDILSKVVELRKMLSRAKETNDMHAGEVYGERAILATEARELRSRLAQLSTDKDKAFSMIDEMQENLQARIGAARKEREAAEEEKMRKEENARKVLSMEEALMAKVAQDSRELEQEAETNTKLRESLIDCGHMVDALQGEVSVLSEDVKVLKEQMDGGITKFANGFLNINLAAPPRCQNMDGHWTASSDHTFGSFSLRTHGGNDDINMSKFSMRSCSLDSQDAQSLHSSLYQSIDNVSNLIPTTSSARLAEFVPCTGFPLLRINNDEMDYLTSGVERCMAETDTECQGASPQISNYPVEAEKQQYVKTGSDDGWQMLDAFDEEFRKSVSGSPPSSSVKAKQS